MAQDLDLFTVPGLFTVTDLSAKQFYAVKLSAQDTVAIAAAATDRCLGILQDNPKGAAGAPVPASVRFLGVSKAYSDGSGTSIAAGDLVGPSATGTIVKKATADYNVMGIALDPSTAAGTIIRVLLTPYAMFRTLLG